MIAALGRIDCEVNSVKGPDCGATVKFQKSDISCSQYNWQPSPTVLSMYRLAPLTNRRILSGTLLVFATAGGVLVFNGTLWPVVILGICGLALVPISFAVRAYAVKRMMTEYEGV